MLIDEDDQKELAMPELVFSNTASGTPPSLNQEQIRIDLGHVECLLNYLQCNCAKNNVEL